MDEYRAIEGTPYEVAIISLAWLAGVCDPRGVTPGRDV